MQFRLEPRNAPWLSVLAVSIGLFALPISAVELTQSLTAEEVACNELQLEKLLSRMEVRSQPGPHPPKYLLVSYSNSGGLYEGLAATAQYFGLGPDTPPANPYEHYLAFNINPSIRKLLLNPARKPLPQAGLNRERSNSNLVAPNSYFSMTVELAPTSSVRDSLVINNFSEPAVGAPYNGFLATSTRPGRGLVTDQLLEPCHGKLTDFDRHVFAILQRIVRAEFPVQGNLPDVEIAIFRGEEPHTYRLNLYPEYEDFPLESRLAAELKLTWSPRGMLTTVEMTALPACAEGQVIGCTSGFHTSSHVVLIPPVFGGRELYQLSETVAGAFFSGESGPGTPVTADLHHLLAGTTWNEPIW